MVPSLRSLRRNPGFAAVAVVSLALGIGVNTAIFSMVDQLLLWSVPARDPDRLVAIRGGYSDSYPFFREYRDRNQVFSAFFAGSNHLAMGLRPEGAPAVEVGHVHFVSGGYFPGLGIGAAAGRVIVPADDVKPGGSPVAVLSYDYWQRRFAGDRNVIGRKLAVNGFPLEIVGVAERGFQGLYRGRVADAFVPLTMFPVTTPSVARAWNTPNMFWLNSMARLKPGVSLSRAQAALQVLWPQAADAVNSAIVSGGGRARKFRQNEITLAPGAAGSYGGNEMLDPLKALIVAAGLVLLIACANVANLLLSRATGRRKEIAVRLSLGATRGRLIGQLLRENLVLAGFGGALGIAFAYWGVAALARLNVLDPDFRFRPSLRVLAFSVAVTLVTGLLFGLAPALRTTRISLAEGMKDAGPVGVSGARLRLGKLLVAAQVALSLTLLAGAGLFIRTLRNLENIDLGFERENVIIADIDPTNLGYRGQRLRIFYDQLLERARAIPGVRAAGLMAITPMGNYLQSARVAPEGYELRPGETLGVLVNTVSSGYMPTLGVPILLGRDFRPEDEPAVTPGDTMLGAIGRMGSGHSDDDAATGSRVCMIDDTLARNWFGDANPIGLHVTYGERYKPAEALEIVGVVKRVHYTSVKQFSEREGMLYLTNWAKGAEVRSLAVRVAGNPRPVIAALRRELRALDANVPLLGARTLEEYVNSRVWRERLIALLSGFFAVLALALAAVGLYGVMAYAVTQRTREIGIRMALGAQRAEVVRMIVRESLTPVLIGVAVGLGVAFAGAKVVASLLYGVAPRDPLSLAIAVAAMLAVSVAAAAIPARRASRVEPVEALRYE
jgi:predicted permease